MGGREDGSGSEDRRVTQDPVVRGWQSFWLSEAEAEALSKLLGAAEDYRDARIRFAEATDQEARRPIIIEVMMAQDKMQAAAMELGK